MIQQKQIELYVYLHSIRNGIISVSPSDNILRQTQLPISEVEVECAGRDTSRILLRLPEYLALGKGMINPVPVALLSDSQRISNDTAGDGRASDSAKSSDAVIPVRKSTPASVMTDKPLHRFDKLTEEQQSAAMGRAFLNLIKPEINQIEDEVKQQGGLSL